MSIDFIDATSFSLAVTNFRTLNEIDICTLKPSYIYRSGELNECCFFSDKNTIVPYMHSGRPLIKYNTSTPLDLMVFSWKNIQKIIETLPAELQSIFATYIVSREPRETEHIIFPASPYRGTYLNKVFAMLVCEQTGLSGWIATPECDVMQQNIDFENSNIDEHRIVYKTNPYYPEIMLCKPKARLAIEQTSQAKKSRKNSSV